MSVARRLTELGHEAWTAHEANLGEASDETILVYASAKAAIAVTTNKDCADLARRRRLARTVYLRTSEAHAVAAAERAEQWLQANRLPEGMVVKVSLTGEVKVLTPKRDP